MSRFYSTMIKVMIQKSNSYIHFPITKSMKTPCNFRIFSNIKNLVQIAKRFTK